MDSTQWQPPSCEELQTLLAGYDVLQFIARGGMGAVYRGVQRSSWPTGGDQDFAACSE